MGADEEEQGAGAGRERGRRTGGRKGQGRMRSRRAKEVADREREETAADGRKRKEGARLREGRRGARETDLARACTAREERGVGGVKGWAREREAVGCEKTEGQHDEREAKRGGGGHKPVRSAKGEPSEAK